MAYAVAFEKNASPSSRTLLRRQQRTHTKASYQQLKARLLAVVLPVPQASYCGELEDFRASLYCVKPVPQASYCGEQEEFRASPYCAPETDGGQLLQCSWCGVSLSIAGNRRGSQVKSLHSVPEYVVAAKEFAQHEELLGQSTSHVVPEVVVPEESHAKEFLGRSTSQVVPEVVVSGGEESNAKESAQHGECQGHPTSLEEPEVVVSGVSKAEEFAQQGESISHPIPLLVPEVVVSAEGNARDVAQLRCSSGRSTSQVVPEVVVSGDGERIVKEVAQRSEFLGHPTSQVTPAAVVSGVGSPGVSSGVLSAEWWSQVVASKVPEKKPEVSASVAPVPNVGVSRPAASAQYVIPKSVCRFPFPCCRRKPVPATASCPRSGRQL